MVKMRIKYHPKRTSLIMIKKYLLTTLTLIFYNQTNSMALWRQVTKAWAKPAVQAQINANIALRPNGIERILPAGYLKINNLTPTTGFNRNEFEKLKFKTLRSVNEQIADCLDNTQVPNCLDDFKTVAKHINDQGAISRENLIANSSPNYDKQMDPHTSALIGTVLKNCGINLHQIIIRKMLPDNPFFMSVYNSTKTPGKCLLEVHPSTYEQALDNQCYMPFNNGPLLLRQFLELQLNHEACHILHNDGLIRAWLRHKTNLNDNQVFTYQKLCEERADLFGVFNGPNPLASALALKDWASPTDPNDLYRHRTHPNWSTLITGLKKCYTPELLAKQTTDQIIKLEHE